MMLADASEQRLRTSQAQNSTNNAPQVPQQQPQVTRNATPEIKQERMRAASPVLSSVQTSPNKAFQVVQSSPSQAPQPVQENSKNPPLSGLSGKESTRKVETPKPSFPRFSTHRIMDILNNDQEVPVSKTRDAQTAARLAGFSYNRERDGQHDVQHQNSAPRLNSIVHREEPPPVDQALMDALEGPSNVPSNPPMSPPSRTHPWSMLGPRPSGEPEESLRRRDPLQKIRELLDKKAREHGREPAERSSYWRAPSFSRGPGAVNTNSQERPEVGGYDPQRPSTGLYQASPNTTQNYPSAARRESQDHGASHWERGRRTSASQQPSASPYQSNAPQPYQGEHNAPIPTTPTHQSPYMQPHNSLPLPPKPPGPPPSAPINFRFAHYDPAPPRQPHPPPTPSYPPSSSYQPHAPPTSQYLPPYNGPPTYQGGYVPPPGSFQAPPPQSSLSSYPPLKIHQYGGQPILPASMAPPLPAGPPMGFAGQSAPQAAYSPPQPPMSGPHFDQRDPQGDRPPEPQSRPRRQYRSYHAPGTQFRTYQGPGENRRKGS